MPTGGCAHWAAPLLLPTCVVLRATAAVQRGRARRKESPCHRAVLGFVNIHLAFASMSSRLKCAAGLPSDCAASSNPHCGQAVSAWLSAGAAQSSLSSKPFHRHSPGNRNGQNRCCVSWQHAAQQSERAPGVDGGWRQANTHAALAGRQLMQAALGEPKSCAAGEPESLMQLQGSFEKVHLPGRPRPQRWRWICHVA